MTFSISKINVNSSCVETRSDEEISCNWETMYGGMTSGKTNHF